MYQIKFDYEIDYTDEIYEAIRNPLLKYSSKFIGPFDPVHCGLCAYDTQNCIQGGILGQIGLGRLYIQNYWVNEPLRGKGIGSQLLKGIEEWAKTSGATLSWLCTTEYLALDFYKKRGYAVFGELPFHNTNENGELVQFTEYFMKKQLT